MRRRLLYAILTLWVIALGLASRQYTRIFPAEFGKYPGDALWALMVFLSLSFISPKTTTLKRATYALLFSFAIEFSQLYQAPWINSLRWTTLGRLILGTEFSWIDLVAYSVGIACGAVAETLLTHARRNS